MLTEAEVEIRAARTARALRKRLEREACEESLYEFVKTAWSSIDGAEYQDCWALEALCDHLQAVTEQRIRKLLVNFPPRCAKTTIASVCWPVWTWIRTKKGYLSGPHVEFLCGSYGQNLSRESSNKSRQLIMSPWFQDHWGDRFVLRTDQNTKDNFANDKNGARLSTSVGGSLLGIGGSVILVDDPHNTKDVESEAERETTLSWWKEIRSTRLNDPKRSAIVVIMQRLHEVDVSGTITKGEDAHEWVHLMIPMEFDTERHCVTDLGSDGEFDYHWHDPRSEDGELMWPERFGEKEVAGLKSDLGPYMASGRLQQQPTPAGGGILNCEWWEPWDEKARKIFNDEELRVSWQRYRDPRGVNPGEFPPVVFTLASLDTAYTEKQENDYSALTVWGVWNDPHGNRRIMLMYAWRARLALNDLVTRVAKTCKKWKIDKLLIENKAAGISTAQEIARLYSDEHFGVEFFNPTKYGDKVARAYSVQGLFQEGMIWAPSDRAWAQELIDECAAFPKGQHDDRVDSTTQAVRWLRDSHMMEREPEREIREHESMKFRKAVGVPLYDV